MLSEYPTSYCCSVVLYTMLSLPMLRLLCPDAKTFLDHFVMAKLATNSKRVDKTSVVISLLSGCGGNVILAKDVFQSKEKWHK